MSFLTFAVERLVANRHDRRLWRQLHRSHRDNTGRASRLASREDRDAVLDGQRLDVWHDDRVACLVLDVAVHTRRVPQAGNVR